MITLSDIWDKFLPIIQFLSGLWDWLNLGIWTAYIDMLDDVPLLGKFHVWFNTRVADLTGIDEFLEQYTMLTFCLGSGLALVIILSIIGFIGDKFGA